MASDTAKDDDPLQIIDCESIPIPPGTKRGKRVYAYPEQQPISTRIWLLFGAITVTAFVAGVLIGRFL
jgi:hypothetical protein